MLKLHMHRVSTRSNVSFWMGFAAIGQLLCACATGSQACTHNAVTGEDDCNASSGDYGEAIGTAAVAAGSWAVVGCTVNGCEAPFRCNGKTKMCERISCGEGQGSCPPAYNCDPKDNLCK